MQLGYIGLGKMGLNMVGRLRSKWNKVVVYNRSPEPLVQARKWGAVPTQSLSELVSKLKTPRTIWIMVPWQAVDDVLVQLIPLLSAGDTVIDGGNSPYTKSIERARMLQTTGIHFLDVGVSGGPEGARTGACVMVGGDMAVYTKHEKLFKDISVKNGYQYVGTSGAGHFVKMIHNGIEYGMMQAIAEGFATLRAAPFQLNLNTIADLYNHGSVIESRLIGFLANAYTKHSDALSGITGSVSHSGEGQWTVEAAKQLGVTPEIIERSLQFRIDSTMHPNYIGQVLSAMRHEFGGHDVASK